MIERIAVVEMQRETQQDLKVFRLDVQEGKTLLRRDACHGCNVSLQLAD